MVEGARLGVRRHARARRVELVDDGLAVDAKGDRLSDLGVVERGELVVEAEVHEVQAVTIESAQVDAGRHRLGVLLVQVVDAVDRARLQLGQTLSTGVGPADDDPFGHGRPGAVAIEPGEGDVRAAVPRLEHERARPVHVPDDGLLPVLVRIDRRLEPAGVLDRQRRGGDPGEEGHIRLAQLEDHRGGVGCADALQVPGVRPVRGIRGIHLAAGRLARGRVRDRRERHEAGIDARRLARSAARADGGG